jgi:GxxExxY protein
VLVLIVGYLTERVIGLAIVVHWQTGPGLLETVYAQSLSYELLEAGILYERQVAIPIRYKGLTIGQGFQADIVVAQTVIRQIKSPALRSRDRALTGVQSKSFCTSYVNAREGATVTSYSMLRQRR